MHIPFRTKQRLKKILQQILLPRVYQRQRFAKVKKGKIIFADGHCDSVNASMKDLYNRLKSMGYDPMDLCANYNNMNNVAVGRHVIDFMKEYATAEYVFISDYFLPVASCRKRKETKVIQLWHAGGMLKKMGYDAADDLKGEGKANPTKNYDLVTTSAPVCEKVWANAWHISEDKVKALGIARTDKYYNNKWNQKNINRFYKEYPEAKGKRICIYAPSFEGNASKPYDTGLESGILDVFKKLEDEWYVVVKLHPHMQAKYPQYNCCMSSEELFAVADLLITDYSSIIFDYMIYRKPFVLYAPGLEEYKRERGFYLDYESLPAPVIKSTKELYDCMNNGKWQVDPEALVQCFNTYMGACDGKSIDRILSACGLLKEEK